MNKVVLTALVCLIVAGAVGFFAGMQFQKSQQPTFAGRFGGGNGQFARRFGQNGQNYVPVRGQVLSVDNNSLTVKLNNGNSQIVVLAPSTQYYKSQSASVSDVASGNTVMVLGSKNSDGSVTAQVVQLNPQAMMRPSGAPTQ